MSVLAAGAVALSVGLAVPVVQAPPASAAEDDIWLTVLGNPETPTKAVYGGVALGNTLNTGYTGLTVWAEAEGVGCNNVELVEKAGDDGVGTGEYTGDSDDFGCSWSYYRFRVITPACLETHGNETFLVTTTRLPAPNNYRTYRKIDYDNAGTDLGVFYGTTDLTDYSELYVVGVGTKFATWVSADRACALAEPTVTGPPTGVTVAIGSAIPASNGGASYNETAVGGTTGGLRVQVQPPDNARYWRFHSQAVAAMTSSPTFDLRTIPVTGGFYDPLEGQTVLFRQRVLTYMGYGTMSPDFDYNVTYSG